MFLICNSTGRPEDFCWNDSDENTLQWGTPGDADLEAIVEGTVGLSVPTYDACTIEFEFRCAEDMVSSPEVSFNYMFGSDEYYEYVDSAFNDAFAFFVNGQNIALLPDGVTPVTINNVNYQQNSQYFNCNDESEPGGMTVHTSRARWLHVYFDCKDSSDE